jgi:outer membrane lipoprotein-sorting protein
MRWLYSVLLVVLAGAASLPADADASAAGTLTVDQILERHIAARGGADAWHKIQTMAWSGHVESGPGGITKVPFMLLFRRPDLTRFEMLSAGQHLIRVFDGHSGWKMRPNNSGLPEVTDYNPEDINYAKDAEGLDGPLFDSRAKGVRVALLGMDSIEGHQAYHLKVTLPSGQVHDDWIDTQTFLELRYDRETRSASGHVGIVSVFLRNYQAFGGLLLPTLVETGGRGSQDTDKMVIEKVALNPAFTESQFAKPTAPKTRHNGVLVNTQPGAPSVTH